MTSSPVTYNLLIWLHIPKALYEGVKMNQWTFHNALGFFWLLFKVPQRTWKTSSATFGIRSSRTISDGVIFQSYQRKEVVFLLFNIYNFFCKIHKFNHWRHFYFNALLTLEVKCTKMLTMSILKNRVADLCLRRWRRLNGCSCSRYVVELRFRWVTQSCFSNFQQ